MDLEGNIWVRRLVKGVIIGVALLVINGILAFILRIQEGVGSLTSWSNVPVVGFIGTIASIGASILGLIYAVLNILSTGFIVEYFGGLWLEDHEPKEKFRNFFIRLIFQGIAYTTLVLIASILLIPVSLLALVHPIGWVIVLPLAFVICGTIVEKVYMYVREY